MGAPRPLELQPRIRDLVETGVQHGQPESHERDAEAARDPLHTFPQHLLDLGVASEQDLEQIKIDVDLAVEQGTKEALEAPHPPANSALDFIYSPDVDPTSSDFDSPAVIESDAEKTFIDLVNACLRDEMARDPSIVVFGQDVADASRSEVLEQLKGKGGVFKATHGLQRLYGGDRVFNSPLARGLGVLLEVDELHQIDRPFLPPRY